MSKNPVPSTTQLPGRRLAGLRYADEFAVEGMQNAVDITMHPAPRGAQRDDFVGGYRNLLPVKPCRKHQRDCQRDHSASGAVSTALHRSQMRLASASTVTAPTSRSPSYRRQYSR